MGTDTKFSIAKVLLEGIQESFSYRIPDDFHVLSHGCEVAVPLGKRTVYGWIDSLGFDDENSKNLKLKGLISAKESYPKKLHPLFEWLSDYYGASLYDAISQSIPTRTPTRTQKFAKLVGETHLKKIGKSQQEFLTLLIANNGTLNLSDLAEEFTPSTSSLKGLVEKGIIEISHQFIRPNAKIKTEVNFSLTNEQELALEKIKKLSENNSAILLHGVTGAGKTEIYLRLVKEVIEQGKTAIIIVPEIALTPQLFTTFQDRIGVPVALLHSALTAADRWNRWERIMAGDYPVVIGARSAIFSPVQNVGLIIVDEEHDSSYKQGDNLRYHGRDVAIVRAKLEGCPIILGSATPSFETIQNVIKGRIEIVEIKERATKVPLPNFEVVNLCELKRSQMPSENISPKLKLEIEKVLEEKKQAILLYNRRGFSSFLQCESCGKSVACPNCSVTMTLHKRRGVLMCHYCGYKRPIPEKCLFCNDPTLVVNEENKESGKLAPRGGGTEKIIEELTELFPAARILQMDRDTTTNRDSYEKILSQMKEGAADILVGTQMIAKGHDIQNVNLVGIIDADIGLHFPDFRASERVFQLVTQAGGRAGRRAQQGKVVIQTSDPDHPTIVAIVSNKYNAFARFEMEFRKKLRYPPYARLARVVTQTEIVDEILNLNNGVKNFLDYACEKLKGEQIWYEIIGPAPCPISKIKNAYRSHFLIKTNSSRFLSVLAKELNSWKRDLKLKTARVIIDIDPQDLL